MRIQLKTINNLLVRVGLILVLYTVVGTGEAKMLELMTVNQYRVLSGNDRSDEILWGAFNWIAGRK